MMPNKQRLTKLQAINYDIATAAKQMRDAQGAVTAGFKNRRIQFTALKRGSMERITREGVVVSCALDGYGDGGVVNVQVVRADGSLGEHWHRISIRDITAVA